MRAVKLASPGKIELVDVPVPEISDTEVLVKVAGAGLCHSDLAVMAREGTPSMVRVTVSTCVCSGVVVMRQLRQV